MNILYYLEDNSDYQVKFGVDWFTLKKDPSWGMYKNVYMLRFVFFSKVFNLEVTWGKETLRN